MRLTVVEFTNIDKIKLRCDDRGSRSEFGAIATNIDHENYIMQKWDELRRKRNISVRTSFGADGNLITSDLELMFPFDNERRKQRIQLI